MTEPQGAKAAEQEPEQSNMKNSDQKKTEDHPESKCTGKACIKDKPRWEGLTGTGIAPI